MPKQITKTYDASGTTQADFKSPAEYKAFFKGRDLRGADENYTVLWLADAPFDFGAVLGSSDDTHRVRNQSAPGRDVQVSFVQQGYTAAIPTGFDFPGMRVLLPNVGDKPHLYIGHTDAGSFDVDLSFCRILDQSGSTHETLVAGIGYGRLKMDYFQWVVDSVPNKISLEEGLGRRFRHGTFAAIGASKGSTQFLKSSYGGTALEDSVLIGGGPSALGNVQAANCFSNTDQGGYKGITVNTAPGALVIDEAGNFHPNLNGPLIGAGNKAGIRQYDIAGNYVGEVPDVGAWQGNVQPLPAVPDATVTGIDVNGQTVTVHLKYTSIATGGQMALAPAAPVRGAPPVVADVVLVAPGEAIAVFRGVLPGEYADVTGALANATGPGTLIGGKSFEVSVPEPTEIHITAVKRHGTDVEVLGYATNSPVKGAITLVGANGSPNQGPLDITFDAAGRFSTYFIKPAVGKYVKAIGTASNYSGDSTAEGPGVDVIPPGQVPPGTPRVTPTPYKAPAFDAPTVRDGGLIATLTLENKTAAAATNQPFTFGMAFRRGQLKMSDSLVGAVDGKDLSLQFDPKATWPDGSAMHGIVSGLLPAIDASAQVALAVRRSTAARGTAVISLFQMQQASAVVQFTATIGGVVYSASPADLTTAKNWLSGPVCVEYIAMVPLTAPDGTKHPTLQAQFAVRGYPDAKAGKVSVTVENGTAYHPASADVTYDAAISIAGEVKYSKAGLVHFHAHRWSQTVWAGAESVLHVKHDVAQVLDTKVVPNWNRYLKVSETTLQNLVGDLKMRDVGPMGTGRYYADMGSVGGRPDIGLAPAWHVLWLLSQDKRAAQYAVAHADVGGSYGVHLRDPNTGSPMDCLHWPYATKLGAWGDANNPDTGKNEHFLDVKTAAYTQADASHHPAFSYIPYLLTGDYRHLEELAFWGTWCINMQNCQYRGFDQGLMVSDQMRAQGWTLRDLAELAAITPDDHPQKAAFRYLVDCQLGFWNKNYTDNPQANNLGLLFDGYTLSYNNGRGIAPWQASFTTSAVGHCSELGFSEATRLLGYLSKFHIGTLTLPDICYVHGMIYALNVRDDQSSPFYSDLSTCYKNTLSAKALSLPCASQELADWMNGESHNAGIVAGEIYGLAQYPEGYPANGLPAVSFCVDANLVPHCDVAFGVYKLGEKRPPDYSAEPQFCILPRTMNPDGSPIALPVPQPDPVSAPTPVVTVPQPGPVKVPDPVATVPEPVPSFVVVAMRGKSVIFPDDSNAVNAIQKWIADLKG